MGLLVDANLNIEIDGQPATLTGSGQLLRLTVSRTRILASFLAISMPNVAILGKTGFAPKDFPSLLTHQGLTLEIVDDKGPLLVLGEAVKGRSYLIPGIGVIRDVALANVQAAARLAFNF